jgi:putative ABC transport system permease protein
VTLLVSTASDPSSLAAGIRAEVAQIDRGQPVANVRTLRDLVDNARAKYTVTTLVFATFGVAALIMSIFAVYGMTLHATAERQQEIGIRLALGATRRDVLTLLIRETVLLGLAGTAVGLTLSWVSGRVLESVLFAVQPRDPATSLSAACGCFALAVLCALVAARRVVRMEPVEVLRRG